MHVVLSGAPVGGAPLGHCLECRVCLCVKSADQFPQGQYKPSRNRGTCKLCHNARYSKAAGYDNPHTRRIREQQAATYDERLAAKPVKCYRCKETKLKSNFGPCRWESGYRTCDHLCLTCRSVVGDREARNDNGFFAKASQRQRRRFGDMIRESLRGGYSRCRTAERLGYSIIELRAHLEGLFTDGMNWDQFNAGKIHIDHRRPLASFDLSDPAQVLSAWSLSNLQPLWARDNLSKGARYFPEEFAIAA